MKFVDTLLFAEPHEADLLWVKLNVEEDLFEEWVVVEGSHTHQGEHKGFHLNQLLATDHRFDRFRTRIHVIELDMTPRIADPDRKVFDDEALTVERTQRDAAVPYLVEHYEDDDHVLISDVDECLDAASPSRRRLLRAKAEHSDGVVLVPRIRYWFDYDNRWLARRCVPLVTIGQLKIDPGLEAYRERSLNTPIVWRHEMVFEYSFCFPREHIMRKFDTFIHTGFEPEEVDEALRYNHRPTSRHRARLLRWTADDWFVKRRLTPRNSPAFVRRHLDELRTGVVDPAYRRNRRQAFPEYFPRRHTARIVKWLDLYARLYLDVLARNPHTEQWTRRARAVGRRARRLGRR